MSRQAVELEQIEYPKELRKVWTGLRRGRRYRRARRRCWRLVLARAWDVGVTQLWAWQQLYAERLLYPRAETAISRQRQAIERDWRHVWGRGPAR